MKHVNRAVESLLILALSATPALAAVRSESSMSIPDDQITGAIETELLVNDAVPAEDINVMTRDGIVTLDGSVNNLLARERASEVAESIKGVRAVVDEIEVKPVPRSDLEIQGDVTAAFASDPLTRDDGIAVSVHDGHVTLDGRGDSFAKQRLVTEIAEGVRGVKSVENDITVELEHERPDADIATEIRALLRDDVRIDPGAVGVAVKDGKVTLSGDVSSAWERTLAKRKAWVAGVRAVDVSGLEIAWWRADDSLRQDAETADLSDADIDRAVAGVLAQDPRVQAFDVVADASYGTVTLTGEVDNLKAKQAAAEDAQNTIGVWRVENHLRVRPDSAFSDAELVTRVYDALGRDPFVGWHDISVAATNGTVRLYGDVDTDFEKREATDVAYRVGGVLAVDNALNVSAEQPLKSDTAIRDDVESQLYWDAAVNGGEVQVSVDGGAVTLTGAVDTWYEYTQAAQDAYEGGATSVRNDLQVRSTPAKGAPLATNS